MKNKVGNSLDENNFTNVPPHEWRNEKTYAATKDQINDDSVHIKVDKYSFRGSNS